jgi:hypothetical protein
LTPETAGASFAVSKTRSAMNKKKKRLILLLLALLAVSAAVLFTTTRPNPTFVYGDLPPQDVSGIEAAVRHNIRLRLFPDYSWTSIKQFPASIKTYIGHHIQAVSKKPDGLIEVNVRYRGIGKGLHAEIYTLQKNSNSWQVVSTRLLVN